MYVRAVAIIILFVLCMSDLAVEIVRQYRGETYVSILLTVLATMALIWQIVAMFTQPENRKVK